MFVPTPPRQSATSLNAMESANTAFINAEEEQDLRAFVGRNSDYYLSRWKSKRGDPKAHSGYNLAGFFIAGLWPAYRRMYKKVLIVYSIVLLLSLLEYCLFIGIQKMNDVPRGSSYLMTLFIGIFVSINGNDWYLAHARREIAKVRSQGLEKDVRLQTLAQSGGTDPLGMLGLFVVFMVAMYALYYLLGLLFFPQ